MKQKVKRLIQDMRECADLLQHHGEATWADRLKHDLKRLEKRGRKAIDDELHLFRCEQDWVALTLSKDRGHLVNPIKEREINDVLDGYRQSLRRNCAEIMAGRGAT